ncbi:MAG: hypothetical protein DRO16_02105 [Thermoprotei archaeon]|nr:MAG: hypothetical protein DRO16_02105 [Thermoprotei archaeon]
MRQIILIFMLLIISKISAQEWTEPVNISNNDQIDLNPTMCIDNNGIIHSVWSVKLEPNFHKLFYSNSEDNGESWSTPEDIIQNNEMWMDLPHIVCDSQNNLHLAYLYNVGNPSDSHIYYMRFDGENWDEPYCISENYLGVGMSDVIVDNNDRIYVFWGWGGPTGEFYYRYLEDETWSNVICPYGSNDDSYSFCEGVTDSNNNLHCVIEYHSPGMEARASYIKYDYENDNWEDVVILADDTSWNGKDIALDSYEFPHLVWRQYVNNNAPPNDGTLYSYFDGLNFTEPQILVEDPFEQVLVIDENNNKHIVEREKTDIGWKLVYYFIQNSNIEGIIIDENTIFLGQHRLLKYSNFLLLIYRKYNDPTDIYFTRKELSVNSIEEHYINDISFLCLPQNYPNPFNPQTKISYSLNRSGSTTLKILNIKGQLVKTLVNEYCSPGEYTVAWDGTDKKNKPVASGVYYYRLQVNDRVKTKSLTVVK